MRIQYTFEGRSILTDVSEELLDFLAGLVICYRLLSKDRVTKAAKAQEAFIRGYLYGLEVSKTIDSNRSEQLYKFFMNQEGAHA